MHDHDTAEGDKIWRVDPAAACHKILADGAAAPHGIEDGGEDAIARNGEEKAHADLSAHAQGVQRIAQQLLMPGGDVGQAGVGHDDP